MRFLLGFLVSIFFNLPVHAACINPDGVPGELMYNGNYDVFQGCTTRGWKAFHTLGPFRDIPPDCPHVGNTCADGTLFSGFHPVTGKALFAMQEDAPTTLSWNKHHGVDIEDTINLPENDAGRALGHDDWYLPSINELSVMFVSLGPGPKNNFQVGDYWSSSEYGVAGAWIQSFSATTEQTINDKHRLWSVRCIRQN